MTFPQNPGLHYGDLQRPNEVGTNSRVGSAVSLQQVLPKAKEFEAILLGQWLQSAETGFAELPGGEEDKDAGEDQFNGFATQQLAKQMTEAGGIGIAPLVAKALVADASHTTQRGLNSSMLASGQP